MTSNLASADRRGSAESRPLPELPPDRDSVCVHTNHIPDQETIAALFESQATRVPESIALKVEERELTFAQLDRAANRLRDRLVTLGVGPEKLTGVFLDRSAEMVVAMLAVLKAGGAYVPLDPRYPAERIAWVIADSRASVIITTEKERPNLPATPAEVVILPEPEVAREIAGSSPDSAAAARNGLARPREGEPPGEPVFAAARQEPDPPTGARLREGESPGEPVFAAARQEPGLPRITQPHLAASDLAYVIYTSGSTGTPKGVMVEHRNVVSFFAAMDELLGTEPGTWLAVTSISFDISVLELFWTLTRGFTVVLVRDRDQDTEAIAAAIRHHGVTHFQSTPSLARMLVTDPGSLAALGRLKKLLLGGEALPPGLVKTLQQSASCAIYDMYGPTETTVWSTAFPVPAGADFGTSVPIGQPLSNNRAYVLDSELRLVAAGEPGELYLGGESVVRGYWRRPDLTAERFLPDPFVPAGRMYRTGDLARMRTDGNLEFLGRTDFQIKLRGYRIELGEIEAVLERHPALRQAGVVARERRPGDVRLVAYVVVCAGAAIAEADCRRFLAAVLPDYMVPADYVFLDRLPVTPNGKIDRNALPPPPRWAGDAPVSGISQSWEGEAPAEPLSGEAHQEVRPPAIVHGSSAERAGDPIERTVADVWLRMLGIDRVGLDENVFDLGATSLMMPEVQLELKRRLGREVSLIDLFEHHTPRALAAFLAGSSAPSRISTRGQRRRAARMQDESRRS
jgi:amino acid adenylation domain-containing protein